MTDVPAVFAFSAFAVGRRNPLLVGLPRKTASASQPGGTLRAISVRFCRRDPVTNPIFGNNGFTLGYEEENDLGRFLSVFFPFLRSTGRLRVCPGIYMLKEKTIVPMKIAMKRIVIRILLLLSD